MFLYIADAVAEKLATVRAELARLSTVCIYMYIYMYIYIDMCIDI